MDEKQAINLNSAPVSTLFCGLFFFFFFSALQHLIKKISPRKYFLMFHKDGKMCVMMVDQTESFANFLSSFGKLSRLRQLWRSVD